MRDLKRRPAYRQLMHECCGQASTEYGLILFAFLAMLAALAALWHASRDGQLLHLAVEASSHSADSWTGVQDLALF